MSVAASGRPIGAPRSQLSLIALLCAVAAVGWWSTGERMSGMDEGPWTGLGTLGWFLGVWAVMMAAMMLPSVAPTVGLYARGLIAAEKLLPWRRAATYGTAAILLALGLLILVAPDATPGLTIPGSEPMGRMGMEMP
jgi:hypothetical protein